MQRWILIPLFILFVCPEGYRVNTLSKGKVEARGRSKARVNFHRVGGAAASKSNSSFFLAASLIGAFAGTLSVTAAGPGVVVAGAGATAIVSNCAPSLAVVTPALAASSASPALLATIPLAIIAALALVGGLIALHVSTTAALAALAFCPVSNFAQEPMQALVSSQPYLAFPEELLDIMEDGLDGGMPACGGLKSVTLKQTRCAMDDRECHELACREKCCEDSSCTFYQFELDPAADDQAERVKCELGEKHQLVDSNCDKPFFGEMCISRLPLWPQEGSDHTKCVSGYSAGAGFMVDDQMDCQETAVEMGHCYYQYNAEKKTCATCRDMSDVTLNSRDNWKVYKDSQCGQNHVVSGKECSEWQLKSVLLSKVRDTTEVRPGARGCRGNSARCLKIRCREECSNKPDCTFYQFQEGENKCFLGTGETQQVEHPWHGGFVSSERKCKTGFQCPANNQCVDDCSECEGYSQNGPASKGRGKNKRRWCMRNAKESLCYESNWVDHYRGVPLDEWCRGMEKVYIKINETLDERESGENICRKACCSDPDCAVFQMHPDDSKKSGADLVPGSKMECWLGKETEGGKPKFKCTGRKLKRWHKMPSGMGKALERRGCTDGSVACLTKKMCVDHCRTECMGAPIHNQEKGICEPASSYEDEHLEMSKEPKHKHAFKDNVQHAMPKLHNNCDDGYYVDEKGLDKTNYRAQDELIQMQLNSRNLANGKLMDMSEACTTLKDNEEDDLICWFQEGDDDTDPGSCVCEFSEKQDCNTWFHNQAHMKHVVEDVGMLLFGGDLCECGDTPNADGEYECEFGLLSEMPKVRQNAESKCDASIELAGKSAPQCPDRTCKPEFDACQTLRFGDHNCGYTCFQGADEFYCDRNCNCHRELSDDDVQHDKGLSDDECDPGRVCDDMVSCEVLEYGEYGCGYTCKDVKNTVYFCGQDCYCDEE